MIPINLLPPDKSGHKTWRATLPAFAMREMADNLLYGNQEISEAVGCYLDESAIMERIEAGDLKPPEAVNLADVPNPQDEAERVVAWLYQHPESWSSREPLRFSQDGIQHGNAMLYLAEGADSHLPHLLFAAAIMKRADLDIEVVFGSRDTVLSLIKHLALPVEKHGPVPSSALFGNAFFPLNDTSDEGLFVQPLTQREDDPMCVLVDYRSEQVIGRYSLVGWDVGFNDPLSRPPSKMGADIPGGPDAPLTFHLRDESSCPVAHLSDFCHESELFLGNGACGLRDYLLHALTP